AIPLAVWLGHVHRGAFVAINISNVGRALPSLAVISIGLGFFGLGFWNVIFALTVLAWPPMLTNAYVAVDGVDPDVIEAARGMGMRDWQILLKVELPLALPLIFAASRTAPRRRSPRWRRERVRQTQEEEEKVKGLRRTIAAGLAFALAAIVAAAAFAGPARHQAKGTIILGTKDFTEEFVLGQLYKQ